MFLTKCSGIACFKNSCGTPFENHYDRKIDRKRERKRERERERERKREKLIN